MDIAKKWNILFYYLIVMTKIVTDASVEQEYWDYCAHFKYNERSIVFKIKTDGDQINFKLCEIFHTNDSECPVGTVACLQKFNTSETLSLGSSFNVENSSLRSINGSRCTASETYSLVVHINDTMRTPTFFKFDGHCTYHVKMKLPLVNCGLTLFGKYKDLSPLAGPYEVKSLSRTFSINICGVVRCCNSSDSNAFEHQGNSSTSISLVKDFFAAYNGDANLVSFHGIHSDHGTKFNKKLRIDLICDWDKTEVQNNDLTYIQQPKQGKKYLFKLETSYGCIKHSVSWVVNEKFLVYNLTSVCFKNNISTDGAPSTNGSKYYMHFCGPGNLKDSYAEVRETSDGRDTNRGSFLAHLEVTQEGNVRATLDGGAKCTGQNSTQKQFDKTIIEFSCTEKEHGPKFLKKNACRTYFQWRTPNACPKYNTTNCNYLKNEKHDCVFKAKGKYYDISALAGTRILNQNSNFEFKIDVCGSVIDNDAPCMKDVSVAIKNFSETDVTKKLTSLGKFFSYTEKDNNLVLLFITGSYCGTTDYQSSIHFKCSKVEEEPIVLPQTEKCRYEFEWKTRHACPHDLGCWFNDASSNTSIDFGHIHPIKFEGGKYNLEFHVCERFYSLCISDKCTNAKFENMTSKFLMNMTTLEIFLNKPCKQEENFNKVIFNFMCDHMKDNAHVNSFRKIGCDLIVDYHTSTVCPYQNINVPLESSPDSEPSTKLDLGRFEKLAGQYIIKPHETCYIKSPFTNQTLNIRNISNNELFKNDCPIAMFNNSHRFVKLAYNSSQACQLVPGQNISYEVYLLCANGIKPALPEINNKCLLPSEYQGIEYCHLFNAIITTSSTTTLISSVVGCTVILGIACIGFVVRKRCCVFYRPRQSEYLCTYERNAQI